MPQTFYTLPDGTTFSADLLRRAVEESNLIRAIKGCQALRVTLPPALTFKP